MFSVKVAFVYFQLHAKIVYDENFGQYSIRDVGSQTGTLVNDRHVSQVFVANV